MNQESGDSSRVALVPAEAATLTSGPGLVYLLYLVGLVLGITVLIGVVVAYMNKGDAPAWAATHYRFQIRTFWIGLLIGAVGLVLSFVVVGFAVLIAGCVWFIIRCVKGIKIASRAAPYPNPTTWLW